MLPLMLVGYLFLLIFRPYEYWPVLGALRVERVYMLTFMAMAFFSKEKRFIPHPINGMVVVFTLCLLVSGIFAYRWSSASVLIEDYLKFVIFYFMVIISVRNERDFRLVLLSFLVIMLLYVGKSAWEFFVHDRYQFTMGIKRMSGIDRTYGAPNSFSASICYSLPFLWAMLRHGIESKWLRWALWGYGALAIVAIMYSGSRSGMVTALLFFLLVLASAKRKFVGLVVIGILLIVAWDNMPESLQTRFVSTFVRGQATAGADDSAEGRMKGFLQGVDVFKRNPLFGIGPANFQHSWPGIDTGYNAHNVYGQLMGELGILGVLSFGGLVWVVYRTNKNIMRRVKALVERLRESIAAQAPPVKSGQGKNAAQGMSEQPEETVWEEKRRTVEQHVRHLNLYFLISQAVIQTLILMLFKGWGDHNLYRYTWLWLAAVTVLGYHFFQQEAARHEEA